MAVPLRLLRRLLPLLLLDLSFLQAMAETEMVRGAYWYYNKPRSAADLDTLPFTHVFYAFASMDASTFIVSPALDDHSRIANFSDTLRASNPKIKTLISIGGSSTAAALAFSSMASASSSRLTFILSAVDLATRHGFDGLDLDWEFPKSSTDMTNFAVLVSEFRQHTSQTGLLLTAAVYFNVTRYEFEAVTYPVDAIAENLDWINLMEYDLHGSWESVTGEHTALYEAGMFNVDYGITNWLNAGLRTNQAVMGLAAYGHTWYLRNASINGVGAPAIGEGPEEGTWTYDQINEFSLQNNTVCKVDDTTKCAYCYGNVNNATLWVGYDNSDTIATKVEYLRNRNLRGYFFWSLNGDQKGDLAKQSMRTSNGCHLSISIKAYILRTLLVLIVVLTR